MKLDMNGVLEFLDHRSLEIHNALGEEPELQEEFEKNIHWLVVQWMTGAYDDRDHARLVSRFADDINHMWATLYKHPELASKVLATIGLGKRTKHRFFRPTAKRDAKVDTIRGLLELDHPDIRHMEVVILCRTMSHADLEDLMDAHGVMEDDRKTLRAQFKKARTG